ncbi:MAG: SDR family oxidoreductase [Crocinitomicaceae bacterium]
MIIISGASKGIGNYLFETYRQLDVPVIGLFNQTGMVSTSPAAKVYHVDITDAQAVASWFKELEVANITLINCAGINYNSFAHKADLAKWKEVIDVNLIGTFHLIHTLLPLMREQNFGRIINFGSVVAQIPSPGISAYAASKAALTGMSKSIAIENAAKGITINNINLGYSELGMISQVPGSYLDEIKKRIPTHELCTPQDIFNTVEYLRNTEYINGTEINLNGAMI